MIRRLAFFLLRFSLVPFFARELIQRKKVTIIAYHLVSPEVAEAHFTALRRRYNIISLRDFLNARSNGTLDKLPPKALIVTLDDGHKSNYLLKPVFQKYSIPATIFLGSGIAGTNRHFWFATHLVDTDRQYLKRVSDERRLEMLEKVGFSETREFATRQALSQTEIEEMKNIADFQSHTVFHSILPRCSKQRSVREIWQSRRDLEDKFGLSVYALAYPNGDYSNREIEIASSAGYECALTMDFGFNSRRTPLFQLRRIAVNDDAAVSELLVKVSGVWGFLRERVRSKRKPKGE